MDSDKPKKATQSRMKPGALSDHLQGLLGLSKGPRAEDSYADLLAEWESMDIPTTTAEEEIELDLPPGIPLPTLLNYYNPLNLPTRLDEDLTSGIASGSGARFAEVDEDDSGPDGPARSLTRRLKKLVCYADTGQSPVLNQLLL